MAALNFPYSIIIKVDESDGDKCFIVGGSYSSLYNDIINRVPRGMILGFGDDTIVNYELVEFYIDDGSIFARDNGANYSIEIKPDGSCEFV